MITNEVERLRVVLTDIPVSSNSIYMRGQHGRTVLTTAGAAYKTRTQVELGKLMMNVPALDPQSPYRVEFHFELPNIFTDSFGRTLKSGKVDKTAAKWRFEKQDVSNLRKLLEDVLAKVICVDDSTTCSSATTKRWGPTPRVTIIVTELPLNEVGWDASGRHVHW